MRTEIESLRKVLELEGKKGYSDSAVIGGLDKFLRNWTNRNLTSIKSPPLNQFSQLKFASSKYASLTKVERQEWVKAVLNFLAQFEAGQARDKTKPPLPIKKLPGAVKNPQVAGSGSIDSPITVVQGISAGLADKFDKLGVRTVRDLLYFFPNRHLDYSKLKSISELKQGEEETVIANVWQAQQTRLGGRLGTEAIVGDETGNVRVVWFNNPYLARKLRVNQRIVISGRVSLFSGRHVFESPEWEPLEDKELVHTGRLVPLYPLTQGLRPRQVRKLMKGVVDRYARQMPEYLPETLIRDCKLLGLPEAIGQAHYPDDVEVKDKARVRLAFDELLLLQLGVLSKKRNWQEGQPGMPLKVDTSLLNTFTRSLPFKLTLAQERVNGEILADLARPRPMSRLLQGEVGSGKTIIALVALLVAVSSGYQAALMAPTEILAEQHFTHICELLSNVGQQETGEGNFHRYSGFLPHPFTVALLIGDTSQSRKRELQQQILSGEIDLIIGTHALIQKEVRFRRLGLAVIDEQHRFGVAQRAALRQKGYNPHVLVMTATPIPRTLALTLYGDLDLSVIDELPPGRQVIKTKWLKPEQRGSAYNFLRRQVLDGRQAFIICPLVEESETIQAKAATAEYERLSRDVFPELKLGLLHGRMTAAEKDEVMGRFRAGQLGILVSTPVVEVGIDVPNATVMLIESAGRFGLSQLHQFRGRVGRGQEQSYCMLLSEDPSEVARQRLGIIENTQDGFVLAEKDMELRGPGEFFGTRQSGLPDLRMAKLSDVALLDLARSQAIKLFEKDPQLEMPEHGLLVKELARVWQTGAEWS